MLSDRPSAGVSEPWWPWKLTCRRLASYPFHVTWSLHRIIIAYIAYIAWSRSFLKWNLFWVPCWGLTAAGPDALSFWTWHLVCQSHWMSKEDGEMSWNVSWCLTMLDKCLPFCFGACWESHWSRLLGRWRWWWRSRSTFWPVRNSLNSWIDFC